MLWKPDDHCTWDYYTGERIGPGVISFLFLIIFTISTLASVTTAAYSTSRDHNQVYNLLVTIITGVCGIYTFWAYRSQCRPVVGFFMMLLVSLLVSMILSIIFIIPQNEAKKKHKDKNDE